MLGLRALEMGANAVIDYSILRAEAGSFQVIGTAARVSLLGCKFRPPILSGSSVGLILDLLRISTV